MLNDFQKNERYKHVGLYWVDMIMFLSILGRSQCAMRWKGHVGLAWADLADFRLALTDSLT
jgi:hypothetical protein